VGSVLSDLGEPATTDEVRLLLQKYDTNDDQILSMAEFIDLVIDFTLKNFKETEGVSGAKVSGRTRQAVPSLELFWTWTLQGSSLGLVDWRASLSAPLSHTVFGYVQPVARRASLLEASQRRKASDAETVTAKMEGGVELEADAEDDEEEEEEVPEDLKELPWRQQQMRCVYFARWYCRPGNPGLTMAIPTVYFRSIQLRSGWMMLLGTCLVLLFSDPMVGVLSELGNRMGVKPFYIAFVLAPLASNASELIASYNYASKKSSKTITIALSTLTGAGCMNNTFCLAIFMLIIYIQKLCEWNICLALMRSSGRVYAENRVMIRKAYSKF
jgi:hypothetical protein